MFIHNRLTKYRLHAIADRLDITVKALFDAAETHNIEALNEMLLLFMKLKTSNEQEAALEALREIITKESK